MRRNLISATLICLFLSLLVSSNAFAKPKKKKKDPQPPPPEVVEQVQTVETVQAAPNAPATTTTTTTTTVTYTNTVQVGKGIDYVKQPMRFGVGLSLGTAAWPLNAKLFITDYLSVELTGPLFGFGGASGLGLGLVGDILYEGKAFYRSTYFDLSWQAGIGPDFYHESASKTVANFTTTSSTTVAGFHLNAGLQMIFTGLPIDLVWSYRPGFYFASGSTTIKDPQGNTTTSAGKTVFAPLLYGVTLSARYYF